MSAACTTGRGFNMVRDFLHQFRWTAQAHAFCRHHQRTFDQDRMRHHRIQQRLVRQRGVGQAQFHIQVALVAHGLAHREAGLGDHLHQGRARWRVLHVVDDLRLDAGRADGFQRFARGAAGVVVIDGDAHDAALVLNSKGSIMA
jgi:hypothetical protein